MIHPTEKPLTAPKKSQIIDAPHWPMPARMQNKMVAKTKQLGSESTSSFWGITD